MAAERALAPGAPPVSGDAGLLLRVLPPGMYVGRASAMLERSLRVSRRAWLIILSGLFEPLFYLLALGHGLGAMIGRDVILPDGRTVSYIAYIAPGLLAASAMNGAVYDSTFNIYFKLHYARVYDAVLATPMGPVDVALGEISLALIRGGLYAAGFLSVLLGMGLLTSGWALLALPAAVLVAFAFAAVGMASTTFFRSFHDFELVQLVLVPLFLFSATFFPLSVYPRPLQVVVQCLPLYHAVELMRGLTTGAVGLGTLGHIGYFLVMIAIGVVVASRRLASLLLR